jgi:outer membrane protein TolC
MKLVRAAKALLSLIVIIPNISFGTSLSLNDFLKQVQEKNQSIVASKLSEEGALDRSNEGKLIFRPSLFAQAQSAIDKKPTTNKNAQGDRTDHNLFTAGLMQQFNFGLQSKLTYNISHTIIYNASPAFLPQNNFYDGMLTLELTQSLLRNFFGVENQSLETISTSQAKASKLTEQFKVRTIISLAESLYWSLSQMRKIVKVQKESFDRAEKIRNWSKKRLNSGLGESSDFLQADANYKAREYELLNALQEEKNIHRSINSMRGVDSDIFEEDLESVDSTKIKELELPKRMAVRDDTAAAFELEKIAKANAALSIEKNKPTFEVYGTYALNGRSREKDIAVTNTFKNEHDTRAIGLRFVTPIDLLTTNNNINGYKKEQMAAEQNYQRKVFDQEALWNDLTSKFRDAKIKLTLVEKIVEAQKIKAGNERERLNKGRTVTFQVLNFEQDYAQSELAKIQSESSILNIYAQLKTFSEGGN